MKLYRSCALVAPLAVMVLTLLLTGERAARAQVYYSASFDSGSVPAPGTMNGTATITPAAALLRPPFPTGDGNLVMQLTNIQTNQEGTFNVGPLSAQPITTLHASWDMAMGFGTGNPANGMSFNIGPFATNSLYGEYGNGSLLTIAFNAYDNFNGNIYDCIQVFQNGVEVGASGGPHTITLADWQPHHVDVSYSGATSTLTVSYGNVNGTGATDTFSINNFQLGSTGYDTFGWGGRTSSLTEYNVIDNVSITVNGSPFATPGPDALPIFAAGLSCVPLLLRRRKNRPLR